MLVRGVMGLWGVRGELYAWDLFFIVEEVVMKL